MDCSIWCLLAVLIIVLLIGGLGATIGLPRGGQSTGSALTLPSPPLNPLSARLPARELPEGFVVTGPPPASFGTPHDPHEVPTIEIEGCLPSNPINQYPVGPTPASYRNREHIGYRWKESWRPYYWKNYPEPPIWFPARNPAADQPELPPDPEMLRLMETPAKRGDLGSQGISPQGYRYFWRLEKPYQPLCSDFSHHVCRDQPYPHFCFRRYYGKCIHGVL